MATSDLHGNLEGLDPKGADVVVLAGDIAPLRGRGGVEDVGVVTAKNDEQKTEVTCKRIFELVGKLWVAS